MCAMTCGTYGERDEYMELIYEHPLRPIGSDEELAAASEMLDQLLDRSDLGNGGRDYLEALTILIQDFETKNHPIHAPADSEVLKHLVDAKGIRVAQVAKDTKIVESTLSAVMNDKRRLTRDQIGVLARYFSVSPNVFSFAAD